MKQKHLIMIVVFILAAALVLGLILSRCGKETEPSGGSLQVETGTLSEDDIHLGSAPAGSSTDSAGQTPSETSSGQASAPSSEPVSDSAGESDSGESVFPSAGQPASGSSGEPSSQPTDQPASGPSGESASQPTGPSTSGSAGSSDTHTHTFVAVETVAPTASEPGYTLYVCSGCGYSYEGDAVAALTLQQLINQQDLSPTVTGIHTLDSAVSSVLAGIVPQGASNYETLEAIYNYVLTQFRHGGGNVDVSKVMQFSDGKVFKNASELVISYEANQILTEKQGVSDHYAAAFMVLTRAAGFESYVVNGTLNGSNHVWNNVRIGGTLYAFDTYAATAPQFAKTDQELSGYSYTDRSNAIAAQTGFQAADIFTIRLTLTDGNGVTAKEYIWDVDDMPSGTGNFMKNIVTVTAQGTVTYTLQILSGSGSFLLTDENGATAEYANSISGTLAPGSGHYTLQAEEINSMMHFDIRIDN